MAFKEFEPIFNKLTALELVSHLRPVSLETIIYDYEKSIVIDDETKLIPTIKALITFYLSWNIPTPEIAHLGKKYLIDHQKIKDYPFSATSERYYNRFISKL